MTIQLSPIFHGLSTIMDVTTPSTIAGTPNLAGGSLTISPLHNTPSSIDALHFGGPLLGTPATIAISPLQSAHQLTVAERVAQHERAIAIAAEDSVVRALNFINADVEDSPISNISGDLATENSDSNEDSGYVGLTEQDLTNIAAFYDSLEVTPLSPVSNVSGDLAAEDSPISNVSGDLAAEDSPISNVSSDLAAEDSNYDASSENSDISGSVESLTNVFQAEPSPLRQLEFNLEGMEEESTTDESSGSDNGNPLKRSRDSDDESNYNEGTQDKKSRLGNSEGDFEVESPGSDFYMLSPDTDKMEVVGEDYTPFAFLTDNES